MRKVYTALFLIIISGQLLAQSITIQPNSSNGNLLIKSPQYVYGNISTTSSGGADLFFRRSEPSNGIGLTGTEVGRISTFDDRLQFESVNPHFMNFKVNGGDRLSILNNGYIGINTVTPSRFFQVNGSTILTETSDTANVQIGITNSNIAKLVVSSSGFPNGVYIDAFNTGGGHALNVNGSTRLNGLLEVQNTLSVFPSAVSITGNMNVAGSSAVSGNLTVGGNLSKGSGTFKIDHPQDPENKYLLHSFVESPDMMNIYNGNIITDSKGYATIKLPDYFEALNMDFRYQLTVIGAFSQAIVAEKVKKNQFKIQTQKPNVEVSWQVTGVRKDAYAEKNRIKTEVEKPDDEKGYYLHPEAYDLPANRGVLNAKKIAH
ncbi:MAG: hypothetical protein IPH28_05005 [Cytophagaceae bacterium]|nr:hypothetical protein [Cytophagaceae bacterium]